ncbi:MAG: NUDIX domain-containing protein [Nannocystaceae bacterium]|nr:NUDIX domain-containing protein [Nannocystaceae bacterium]
MIWLSADRVLVHRKPLNASFGGGALELPGGKLEVGEGPAAALGRELREEWGAGASRLRVGPVAEVLHHVYPPPGPEVILVVYHVDGALLPAGPVEAMGLSLEPGLSLLACDVAELPVSEFLAADRDWVAAVRDGRVRAPAF